MSNKKRRNEDSSVSSEDLLNVLDNYPTLYKGLQMIAFLKNNFKIPPDILTSDPEVVVKELYAYIKNIYIKFFPDIYNIKEKTSFSNKIDTVHYNKYPVFTYKLIFDYDPPDDDFSAVTYIFEQLYSLFDDPLYMTGYNISFKTKDNGDLGTNSITINTNCINKIYNPR